MSDEERLQDLDRMSNEELVQAMRHLEVTQHCTCCGIDGWVPPGDCHSCRLWLRLEQDRARWRRFCWNLLSSYGHLKDCLLDWKTDAIAGDVLYLLKTK